MKRWDEILKEEPSRELTAAVEAKVFAEMQKVPAGRRWFLKLASISLGLAAMIGGYKLVRKEPPAAHGDFLADLEDVEDLEAFADLDVIEILEELEEWQNG